MLRQICLFEFIQVYGGKRISWNILSGTQAINFGNPWSNSIMQDSLWSADSCSASQDIPSFYTSKSCYPVYKIPPLDTARRQFTSHPRTHFL
jgi:hypothetical protein